MPEKIDFNQILAAAVISAFALLVRALANRRSQAQGQGQVPDMIRELRRDLETLREADRRDRESLERRMMLERRLTDIEDQLFDLRGEVDSLKARILRAK